MDFKFKLGEKVKLKSGDKKGEIKTQKFESFLYNGNHSTMVRYYVHFGGYYSDWKNEDQLESLENYTFDKKFELGLIETRIDAALADNNFELIKQLLEEKQKYTK